MSPSKPIASATPPGTAALLARAAELHGRGRIAEAEALYNQVLRIDPRNPNALNLLGVIHIQRGDGAGAVRLIEKAVGTAPKFPQARHNLGWALQTLGRWKDAEKQYRRVIDLDPKLAESHNNLGNVLLMLGRRKEARAAFGRAIAVRPDYAEAHNNLGDLLRTEGDLDGAVAAFGRALAANPDHAGAQNNLGIALLALDRPAEAEAAFRRATALAPGSAAAWNGLGTALDQQERSDAAIEAYGRALAADPDYAAAHVNLGACRRARGEHVEAAEHLRRAIAIEPANAGAHANLGNVLFDCGVWRDAADSYERALTFGAADVLRRLCLAARLAHDWDRAMRAASRLYALEPDSVSTLEAVVACRLSTADWTDPDAVRRLLAATDTALDRGQTAPVEPFIYFHLEDDPARNLRLAEALSRSIEASVADQRRPFDFAGRRQRDRRIRLGYVCANFRNHATAQHFGRAFAHHDRGRFEVTAYSHGPDDSSVYRGRIAACVDRFVDISGEPVEASAQRIFDDGIDIVIDLMGHTGSNRLGLFALRPAPLAVTAVAYPSTTGASFIDYFVGDLVVTPPGHEPFFSERIVRLPDFYNVNDRADEQSVPPTTRRDHGLADDAVVLCSFNQPAKFEPVMFDAWMRILRDVPQCVLWLLGGTTATENLKREAAARGIDPDRLVVAPPVAKMAHLARLALADLMLDTRVVNGHVTTWDALWMGVPVVTLLGRHMPGRVAASALTAAGLPQLVTRSLDEYEALAVRLARDAAARAALRDHLMRTRATAPLADSARWVRNLERAFVAMWDRFCDGLPPAGIDVAGDGPA